jgi:alcohol dehydrogenase, propanol-preferring
VCRAHRLSLAADDWRRERLGLYGFGASAHIVCQLARFEGRRVFALTRSVDRETQRFALELGASGRATRAPAHPRSSTRRSSFAPAGELVPAALGAVAKGCTVVCAGIHMSDIPSFPYQRLWGERSVRSVGNLTRRDGEEFLARAPRVPVHTHIEMAALEDAEQALDRLRAGQVRGAMVLSVQPQANAHGSTSPRRIA